MNERMDAQATDIAGMNARMEDLLEEGGKVSSRLMDLSLRRVEDLEAKAKELSESVSGISSTMNKWRNDHRNALVFPSQPCRRAGGARDERERRQRRFDCPAG